MTDHFNLPLDTLTALANMYATANGVQVESRSGDASIFQLAPISLLPNAFPKRAFDQAITLAPSFNLLVDHISRDGTFLEQTLGCLVLAPILTLRNCWNCTGRFILKPKTLLLLLQIDLVSNAVTTCSISKKGGNEYEIKQVELNTIAASFAGLGNQVANLHSYLIERYASTGANASALQEFLQNNQQIMTGKAAGMADGVPANPALECLPAAMNIVVQWYKECFLAINVCVLFVVQEGKTNTVDQCMLEFWLFENHKIPVIQMSLSKIHTEVMVDEAMGALTLLDETEVAVVYFRAGYAPTDYPGGDTGIEWQARKKLECSRATKCPSLG